MPKTNAPEIDLTAVLRKLMAWREEAVSQLRNPEMKDAALTLKRQLDVAIAHLELCQRFQIKLSGQVTVLPDLKTMTPSCAYRVVEDNEDDNQDYWFELEIDGKHLELSPGDIITQQSVSRTS